MLCVTCEKCEAELWTYQLLHFYYQQGRVCFILWFYQLQVAFFTNNLSVHFGPHHLPALQDVLDASYCYRCLYRTQSACLSVGYDHEPCKNGWTDQDAFLSVYSDGPNEPYIGWSAHGYHLADTVEWSMLGGCRCEHSRVSHSMKSELLCWSCQSVIIWLEPCLAAKLELMLT